MNTTPAICMTGVRKTFGDVEAVRGIDLAVERGEVVALLGPNGAGKTTAIDMMLGLAAPTSGHVELFGMSPRDAVVRGLVSAVMQTGGLLMELTVREIVEYTAALFENPRSVDEVLATAGITDIAKRRIEKCSGGQQQRVRFAMALVCDPELIILDEPTTGMDVNARREFWEAIHADAARGRTVVFATHYLAEADAWADRVVMMRSGEIVADGRAEDIRTAGGGRVITATWPGAEQASTGISLADLRALPGVTDVEVRGDRVHLRASNSDDVARFLLTRTPATDLEVVSRGLEDVFVELMDTEATEGEHDVAAV